MPDIQHAYPLILNKVASPQYATPVLRRDRLLTWLDRASTCRATVLAADAGYGKTTLLYQWEREVDFPCYWYKLDRNDRDWTFHISYLIEAIGKRYPGFGTRAHSMLQQMGGPGSSRPAVAAYLLGEMHERLTEPCTFIIDDWQYVNAVTEVRGLWNQILRDAPATCRFVFASRVKPKLQFARFKTHEGYAQLLTDDLRFTDSEIAELFRDIYNDPLDPGDVAELERRTEGWAASLQLVEVSLRERDTADSRRDFIQSITATKDSDLFDFLAEEVLDQQPESTRNFLISTSILQQITPEVAERLAGVHDGRRELTELEHRGLFTNRLDEDRYRYHNLFRDFLERRLVSERSRSEVIGLHIHAASYFETTAQWPEAIHHYLRAGLQRQAARLIAKYGEDVVASGRLGLVDGWLQELPADSIRQNARLALLHGEALGIAGRWIPALEALERARAYFSRKGDSRLEALACLKLSTVYSNQGNAHKAAQAAEMGVALVPNDDVRTRLRLQGNLAVTSTRMSGRLRDAIRECQRVAEASDALGLEHFAAIGYHNMGEIQLRMGQVGEAVENLERAARFWSSLPTSPFAHCEDLVLALLLNGDPDRARALALDAARRTAAWPRPNALARFAIAMVLSAEGRLAEAIRSLGSTPRGSPEEASVHVVPLALKVELLFLVGAHRDEILQAGVHLETQPVDSRYDVDIAPARAILIHLRDDCGGRCQDTLHAVNRAEGEGQVLIAAMSRVKVRSLAFDHRGVRAKRDAWTHLVAGHGFGIARVAGAWIRRYAQFAGFAMETEGGPALLSQLVEKDPDGWRSAAIAVLPSASSRSREPVLRSIVTAANRETVVELRRVSGPDIAVARRSLLRRQASRIFVRTFGGLVVRRGAWDGAEVAVDRRRPRALLAVLAAHAETGITRDAAMDMLWPDADGDASVNSLNQTVFQLRRSLDAGYRQGESPDYLVVGSDTIGLDSDLVRTDIQEVRRLAHRMSSARPEDRLEIAMEAISRVEGEFLADFRYEQWTTGLQVSVHSEVRARLLPIALGPYDERAPTVAVQAAAALIRLDPWDETAHLALAQALETSGQKVAARRALLRFAERLRSEEATEASSEVAKALQRFGQLELDRGATDRV